MLAWPQPFSTAPTEIRTEIVQLVSHLTDWASTTVSTSSIYGTLASANSCMYSAGYIWNIDNKINSRKNDRKPSNKINGRKPSLTLLRNLRRRKWNSTRIRNCGSLSSRNYRNFLTGATKQMPQLLQFNSLYSANDSVSFSCHPAI
jgi:hypothetical protein